MTEREALGLALKALKPRPGMPHPEYESLTNCAISACEQALEQPEPEPVAWMMVNPTHLPNSKSLHWEPQQWHISWEAVPLYTSPLKRKPLTDEQIQKVLGVKYLAEPFIEFVRAIEAAHGIKE